MSYKVETKIEFKSFFIFSFARTGETHHRCLEKRGLEFDHIKAFALGGTNDEKNIRLLCRNCNQREAFKIFGDSSRLEMPYR